jgi:hypothetical protein
MAMVVRPRTVGSRLLEQQCSVRFKERHSSMSHKQQYEASDLDYGYGMDGFPNGSSNRTDVVRQWVGAAERRRNRSTVFIVGAAARWPGSTR